MPDPRGVKIPLPPLDDAVKRAFERLPVWLRRVIGVQPVFDAGAKAADFSLDARNGLRQTVTLGADVELLGVANLEEGEELVLHADLTGSFYVLSFTAFGGPVASLGDGAADTGALARVLDLGTGAVFVTGEAW